MVICPTVTAYDENEYSRQLKCAAGLANRVHVDLMDGEFAPVKSPPLENIWWPAANAIDLHLMYRRPMDQLDRIIRLKPRLVIIHNEAEVHHMHFAAELHRHDILAGLAILQDTPVEWTYQIIHSFDHVLVFSGRLGYHGGQADLSLLDKVQKVREHHPAAEIGWDGGVNDQNAAQLTHGGVTVLNVGGFIQKNPHPKEAYAKLEEIIRSSK